MDLTKPAADTAIGILHDRLAILITADNFLRTKSHTNTASLAPVMVKGDVNMFFFP